MGKSRRGHKELSKEQELKYENKEFRRRERDKDNQILQLKREVSSLRKQLARIDLDRYSYIKDSLEEHYAQEEEVVDNERLLADLKKSWLCKECGAGYLEVILYNKIGETWYYRQCNSCVHRTKSQRYSADVKGIIKNGKR